MIRLRFVTGSSTVSTLIRLQERTTMPFTPSHVEAVTPDGLYLGAHFEGGVMVRPPGYDQATMTHELFLDLPNLDRTFSSGSPFIAPDPDTQADRFYAFLKSKIGAPYDWKSILDFVDPLQDHHDSQHVICSALQTLALRACGWFAAPLPVPAHQISPRDLLLCIGGRVAIPGV
jgi:hypothetical protein